MDANQASIEYNKTDWIFQVLINKCQNCLITQTFWVYNPSSVLVSCMHNLFPRLAMNFDHILTFLTTFSTSHVSSVNL